MKLATRTVAAVAIILALGASWAAGVSAPDAVNDSGRHLMLPATPASASTNHISRSMDSWLRWLLFRPRQSDTKSPMFSKGANSKALRPEEDEDEIEEFDDPAQQLLMMPESRQSASKRRDDDYGHMRFGKRDFDDYGHMRFGRR